MRLFNPEVIGEIREGVERGQIELTASAYTHPILPLIRTKLNRMEPHSNQGADAVQLQLTRDLDLKYDLFRVRPTVLRLPEYAVDEDVLQSAQDHFTHVLLSGVTFGMAGLPHHRTVKKGNLMLIYRDDGLSNLLAGMDHYGHDYFKWLKNGGEPADIACDFGNRLGATSGVMTDIDGETMMHHMLESKVPGEKAERYLDALYGMDIQTMHIPEFASSQQIVTSDSLIPASSYAGGLDIWDGQAEHNELWRHVAEAWKWYINARQHVGLTPVVREMQERALRAQTSCFTWAVPHRYPEWWMQQPKRYSYENAVLYKAVMDSLRPAYGIFSTASQTVG